VRGSQWRRAIPLPDTSLTGLIILTPGAVSAAFIVGWDSPSCMSMTSRPSLGPGRRAVAGAPPGCQQDDRPLAGGRHPVSARPPSALFATTGAVDLAAAPGPAGTVRQRRIPVRLRRARPAGALDSTSFRNEEKLGPPAIPSPAGALSASRPLKTLQLAPKRRIWQVPVHARKVDHGDQERNRSQQGFAFGGPKRLLIAHDTAPGSASPLLGRRSAV
jgi:hypothetical protein